MKKRPFIIPGLLSLILALGLAGCSRTVDDVAKWTANGNTLKLIKALADPKVEVRLAATKALGKLKAEPAVDNLASLYNDPEAEVILASVEALSSINSPSVITPIIAALTLEFPQARLTAAITLGNLKANAAVPFLAKTLNDSEANIQQASAVALGQIGDESGSAALVEKLNDTSVELRKTCIKSLAQTGGDTAAAGLIEALADSDPATTEAAQTALINLKSTAIPFALKALKRDEAIVRSSVIHILDELQATPTQGDDFIWYLLARKSIDKTEGIDKELVQTLTQLGEPAIDTLLETAAFSIESFREHSTQALEHIGQPALQKAMDAAEAKAIGPAKEWFTNRTHWNGASSWHLNLWGAIATLNPEFNLNSATAQIINQQGRPAYDVITSPDFKVTREYIPALIALLGDRTEPPPEEPDFNADGIPSIKKKRDLFRGETNQRQAKKQLMKAGPLATLPLLAAIEDQDERIAGYSADILGSQGEKRALSPLMNIVKSKIEAKEALTHSPFYIALQKLDDPMAEPLLLKIRPNSDRVMHVFQRKYPDLRPMSAETKDTYTQNTEPITFRIGYIAKGQVTEKIVTFALDEAGDWKPTPTLSEHP